MLAWAATVRDMKRQRILVLLLAAVLIMSGVVLWRNTQNTADPVRQARLTSLGAKPAQRLNKVVPATAPVTAPAPTTVPTPSTAPPETTPTTAPVPVTSPPVTAPPVTSPPVTSLHADVVAATGCALTGPASPGYTYVGYYSTNWSDGSVTSGSVVFDQNGSGTYTYPVDGFAAHWSYANGTCAPA